jgi:coiled-coil domain-containing protein 61
MESQQQMIEITFHDIDYIATINAPEDKLTIMIEEKYTGEIWKNEIPGKYIEEITQKAGNFKKFSIFVKLLISALQKEDKTTYIDLLTYADLELLKAKKSEEPKKALTQEQNKKLLAKRYLILTVCCESERVHYPLPLNYEENPDEETMRKTLNRLKTELELTRRKSCSSVVSAKANSFYSNESSQLEDENEKLKKKIALFELTNSGAVDMDLMSRSIQEKAKDIDKIKKEAEKEVIELQQKISEREKEIEDTKSELSRTHSEWNNSQSNQGNEEYETLRKTLNDISYELDNEKNANKSIIEKQKGDLDFYQREIKTSKESERKANVKIKQLENELDISMKKLNIALYGTTRSSRGNSSSSKKSSGYGKVSPAPRHNSSSKRTSSLPSSQKKPTYTSSIKKPPTKMTPTNKANNRPSPANRDFGNSGNRRSPYNSRSGSKNHSNTPTNKANSNSRKYSPAQRAIPKQSNYNRNNKPINLQNKKASPAPTKKESVHDRLYGKPIQLTNAAKDVAKHHAISQAETSKQVIEKVEKEIVKSNKLISDESNKVIR